MKMRLFTASAFLVSMAMLALLVSGGVRATPAKSQLSFLAAPTLNGAKGAPPAADRHGVADTLHNSPVMFIENMGQFDPSIDSRQGTGTRFQVPGDSGTLLLAPAGQGMTLADAENVELVGQIGGSTSAIAVQGDYAYIGVGPRLVVLDISNPANPTMVGRTEVLPDVMIGVAVAGNYAYVADYDAGLRIINVSDPAAPTEAGFYDTPGSARGVAVAGNYAYIADGGGGLRIINVSNPVAPTEAGFYDTPGSAWDVAMAGNYAYVADYDAGLRIINVSNPAAPTEAGFYDTPGSAWDVTVVGNYAYVADGGGGLRIINVSDPAAPTEAGFYDTLGVAEGVAVAGNYAYVADRYSLRIINVTDPTAPTEAGFYDTPGSAWDVAVAGNYAYVADGYGGLRIINVSDPAAPSETGFYDTPRWVSGVAVAGSYAYITDHWEGSLRVINVSDPAALSEAGSCDTPGQARGVAVAGNYAYVADGYGGLRIINVSAPAAPSEAGFYDTPRFAESVAVAGNYAYVTDYYEGLRVINVSDPAAPSEAGFYDTPGQALGVAVAGNYAYVADYDAGLRIISVSDPAAPSEAGFYDTPSRAMGVAVAGNYAYVADAYSSLRIINVSDPAAPTETGFYDTPWYAHGVAVAGNYAYVANWGYGLRVINVSNPAAPSEAGFYDTPGHAYGVAVAGNYAYVADGDGGLIILRFTGGPGPTYSISGQVTNADGNPISDVTLSDNAGHTATTDSNGNYTISGLSAGTYTLTPSKIGYTFSPASHTVSVPPSATGQDFTGYDKPPIVFVHGWGGFPPWGPCDWPDPSSNFKLVYDDLKAAGYYVAYAYLETSPCYTPPLIENVPRLRQAIALAKAATNQEKVILIAHSMGGVVSRAYIEGPNYDEDVAALFTFGSPHLGVPVDVFVFLANGLSLGVYCRDYQPAACDLSILGMALFNEDHPTRATGVTYHVISGDAPFLSRSAFGMALDVIIRGPDDALIPTGSGTGLSGTLDRWETDEVHSKGCGSRSYFVRDSGQSLSYVQCLKKVLVDENSNTCGSISPLQVTAEITPMLAERIPFEYGTLLTGQTATRTISLEGGLTLFATQWQTGALAVTLVDPNGQTIDPAYAASHPDVVTYDADATSATYYLPNAIAGVWQLVLQASSDIPAEGSAYTTFAAFDSLLSLTAKTDRDWYAPGDSTTITASLSGSPASAMVTATILRADGVTDTVSLSLLEAGRYQATYTVPDAPGYAEVRLIATGTTASDMPFERGLSLAFQISSNIVTLSGVYNDTPQPRSPGSSFYEALTVTAGINAIINGTVGLSADIVDAGGNFVAHSFTIEDVTTGAGTLTLRFDGDDIYVSRRSGPYTLTNLLLTDRRGAALVVAEAKNVYTTAAYDYRSFASARIYLPLILRNH